LQLRRVGHLLAPGAHLLAHLLVRKRLRPALALVHARDERLHALQLALVLGADDLAKNVVEHGLPWEKGVRAKHAKRTERSGVSSGGGRGLAGRGAGGRAEDRRGADSI